MTDLASPAEHRHLEALDNYQYHHLFTPHRLKYNQNADDAGGTVQRIEQICAAIANNTTMMHHHKEQAKNAELAITVRVDRAGDAITALRKLDELQLELEYHLKCSTTQVQHDSNYLRGIRDGNE